MRNKKAVAWLLILAICITCLTSAVTVFTESAVTVYVGQKEVLTTTGTTEKVFWRSSNPSVATIGRTTGKLTVKKKGKAVITARLQSGAEKKITIRAKVCKHVYHDVKVIKKPTCTVKGKKRVKCTICGKKAVRPIDRLEHAVAYWTTTVLPTCVSPGIKTGFCYLCDKEVTEAVPISSSHNWNAGTIIKPATCGKRGIKSVTCDTCGKTRQEWINTTNNHNWATYKITKESTCSENGIKVYTCSVCGETKEEFLPKKEHTFDSGKVTTAATCDKPGSMTYTCMICKETETKEIAKLDHKWTLTKTDKAATCTEAGKATYTCSLCKKTKTETLAATGHTYTAKVVSPSAISVGYTSEVCTKCKSERKSNYKYYNPMLDRNAVSTFQNYKKSQNYGDGVSFNASDTYVWNGYGNGAARTVAEATVGSMLSYGVARSGSGSSAFAYKLSDEFFGKACPAKLVTTNNYTYKIGDIIQCELSDHAIYSYVVIGSVGNTLSVVSLDYSDMGSGKVTYSNNIKWNMSIPKSSVKSVITRYWE